MAMPRCLVSLPFISRSAAIIRVGNGLLLDASGDTEVRQSITERALVGARVDVSPDGQTDRQTDYCEREREYVCIYGGSLAQCVVDGFCGIGKVCVVLMRFSLLVCLTPRLPAPSLPRYWRPAP